MSIELLVNQFASFAQSVLQIEVPCNVYKNSESNTVGRFLPIDNEIQIYEENLCHQYENAKKDGHRLLIGPITFERMTMYTVFHEHGHAKDKMSNERQFNFLLGSYGHLSQMMEEAWNKNDNFMYKLLYKQYVNHPLEVNADRYAASLILEYEKTSAWKEIVAASMEDRITHSVERRSWLNRILLRERR